MLTHHTARPASQFVTIAFKAGVLRAAPVGPSVNERAAQIIAREISIAVAEAGKRMKALVLDMSQVQQMSSVGLGMCINVRNLAHAAGAATYTLALNRELTDLFRMMRVDRLLTMTRSEEELSKRLK